MTNNSEQQNKDRALKSLAIAGFVGLIMVIAWLGIQLVGVLPAAFSSLASLAETVYHNEPTVITVAANKTIINSEESVTLSWNVPKVPGSFAFSYACADGLAVDMRDTNGSIKSLTCDTNYNVGNVSSLEIIVTTAKTRFTDLDYRIDYIATGKETPAASGDGSLSVVNPTIGSVPTPVEPVATSTPTTTPPVATTTPVAPKPTATTTKPVVTTPTYTEHYTYGIPVSNPNGFVDLMTTFVGVGILDAGTFRNSGTIDNDATGAIQFQVKNYGTKTSGAWTYTAVLPNGTTYTSPTQAPLRPNERAVITIGFAAANITGAKNYSVTAATADDTNTKNNVFSSIVAITE